MKKKVAVLASGSGTNTENIVSYFADNKEIEFKCIISNKADAFVHKRAENLKIPSLTFNKADFESGAVLQYLKEKGVNFIILAGFLLKIPDNLLRAYPNQIINIHPALLPKYGGKGMYGSHVHEAVIAAGEKESGITIHYVNENYDEGQIIFQASCPVTENDTADTVAEKVHTLEYLHFPKVIEKLLFPD